MDIQWMKTVDRYAGVPLCAALRAAQALSGSPSPARLIDEEDERRIEIPDGGKIAVVKFWGMGSLILATPLFRALRQSYPRAEIHMITLAANRGILDILGLADEIHYLELPPNPAAIAGNILGYFGRVARVKPHSVIDLEYLSRFSAIVTWLTRAPVRIGFHSWDVWRGDLHTRRRAFNPYWHVTRNFMNLHRALTGEDVLPGPAEIKLTGQEDEEAQEVLWKAGLTDGERLIAVNPNASSLALARRWPEKSFLEMIERLNGERLGRVALLGSADEADYIGALQSKLARPDAVINLAGRLSLRGFVGTLRRAALLITNDSGPLHLADALGVNTVSFFGPETPTLFGPRGAGHRVLYRGIDCSPCISIYNAKTVRCVRKEPECLSRITVDEALEAARAALGESP